MTGHYWCLTKAYLIALLDDATRMIPYAAFTRSETVTAFLPVFERAILRRGIPKRLYVGRSSISTCHGKENAMNDKVVKPKKRDEHGNAFLQRGVSWWTNSKGKLRHRPFYDVWLQRD